MAVQITSKETGELTAVLKQFRKQFGDDIGGRGVQVHQVPRLSTGVFAQDLAMGGGWPMGRLCIVYGPESSGKTTDALKAAVGVQKSGKAVALIDVEGSYDPFWGSLHGIDNDALVLLQPDLAEQAIDLVEGCLEAEEIGLVILDSIPAMTQENTIKGGGDRTDVAGNSQYVQLMVKKAVSALTRQRRRDHYPTLLCINQVRMKIGVMFGSPETTPGGQALRFASSMTVKRTGNDVMDKKVSESMPTWKEVKGTVMKWKVPIVNKAYTFQQCLLGHEGYHVGDTNEWPLIEQYLRSYELLGKSEKDWMCIGLGGVCESYKTLTEIRDRFHSDAELSTFLKDLVVGREMARVGIPEGDS